MNNLPEVLNIKEISDIYNICKTTKMTGVHSKIVNSYEKLLNNYEENLISNEKQIIIKSIIDFIHDEIHTGHWSEVPINVREAYTLSNMLKVLIMLKSTPCLLEKILIVIDMTFMLGSPVHNSNYLLSSLATEISKNLSSKLKLCNVIIRSNEEIIEDDIKTYLAIKGEEVDTRDCNNFEQFYSDYFIPYKAVKMQNAMTEWPALEKWKSVDYLLKIAAFRTIPIELGSKYSDENWSQKLMLFKEFIENYFINKSEQTGYLAQHNLFEQIPELFQDISFPHYVEFSRNDESDVEEPDCNVWLGPKGTVSPLHYDPRDNILAQIFGSKQVILFAPSDTKYLYPHETKLLNNTAQVDPISPNIELFPDFPRAKMYKCILKAGEMLYIPKQWWHHVTSLSRSFSVNFWWE